MLFIMLCRLYGSTKPYNDGGGGVIPLIGEAVLRKMPPTIFPPYFYNLLIIRLLPQCSKLYFWLSPKIPTRKYSLAIECLYDRKKFRSAPRILGAHDCRGKSAAYVFHRKEKTKEINLQTKTRPRDENG